MSKPDDIFLRSACFSEDRVYRYDLHRLWGHGGRHAMFVGLNPSTADETVDDPTVRRCIAYAKAWGLDGLVMTNIFAFRATDPKEMKAASEPIGLANDEMLLKHAKAAAVVVAAWGTHGTHLKRDEQVTALLLRAQSFTVLGLTKDGHPKHPLYLRKDLVPLNPLRLTPHAF